MSFFQELKRRNVFRVGAAYAVAAWVLLQVLDVVGEILDLPDWAGRLLLALLVAGFFIAVFAAWAYELTPEGVKRERDVDRSRPDSAQRGKRLNVVIVALLALAVTYLLFDKFYLSERFDAAARTTTHQPAGNVPADHPAPPPAPGPSPPAKVSRQSIAVLPFENRSRREEDEFFVEGIHDDLLTTLARIGSLKVISRTSVNKYRETAKTIPEIATELGVATVMEGAVQRSGNTVRINVQLIDAATDEHLWGEIFDRELTADNLFDIQSEISEEIAGALQATLSPAEQERLQDRPTENLAAYNAYLRGRQLLARRNSEDVDQAAREFARAAELDPEFALAWVGISEAAILQSQYSDLGKVEAMERQRMAAEKALAIDDQLGEAWLGRASMAAYNERWEEAEQAYRKALEMSPGYATAWQWYGNLLASFPSRLNEAVAMLQKAVELDPLSSVIRKNLAERYVQLGRFNEAADEFARLQQLDPDFAPVYASRAELAVEQGQLAERVRLLRKASAIDPGNISYYADLLWGYLDLGYLEPAEDIRQHMADISQQHPLLGVVDVVESIHQRNYDGALEAARWSWERSGRPPFLLRIIGYINVARGEYALARTAFEQAEPRLFDRALWRPAIEQDPGDACLMGIVLQHTGDPELGTELATTTLDYLETELPRYIEHTDRFTIEDCYLALGRTDAALGTIETRLAHRHYAYWWLYEMNPHYEPLWGEPRFQAALQRAKDDIAAQRAELIRGEVAAL